MNRNARPESRVILSLDMTDAEHPVVLEILQGDETLLRTAMGIKQARDLAVMLVHQADKAVSEMQPGMFPGVPVGQA